LGHVLRRLERYDEAQQLLERSVELQPRPAAFVNLGLVHRDRGKHAEALAAFDRAAALDDCGFSVQRHRGEALVRLRRFEEAARAFEEALRCDAEDPQVLAALGELRLQLKDPSGALALVDRAIAARPDLAGPVRIRCDVLLELGRIEESLAAAEAGCERFPRAESLPYRRARALLWLGRAAESAAVMEKLRDAATHVAYYRACAAGERWLDRRAAEADPRELHELLGAALAARARGRLEQALEYIEEFVRRYPAATADTATPRLGTACARTAGALAASTSDPAARAAALERAVRELEGESARGVRFGPERLAVDPGLAALFALCADPELPEELRRRAAALRDAR
jgi:tetratricopeptide (TPR) repeat protein